MVDDINELHGILNVLVIGAKCILEVEKHFFLLVEIETEVAEFERVVILRISPELAQILLEHGVPPCEIKHHVPVPRPGDTVKLLCVFTIGHHVFAVFEVENYKERLVVVKTRLCNIA